MIIIYIDIFKEMYHQQLQGIPKNKKSSSGSSRSKAQAAKANAKDSSTNVVKEPVAKKEKKSTQSNVTR